jgi:hypothetical protein
VSAGGTDSVRDSYVIELTTGLIALMVLAVVNDVHHLRPRSAAVAATLTVGAAGGAALAVLAALELLLHRGLP